MNQFNIVPKGIIQGGQAAYTYDDAGNIDYSVVAKIKLAFLLPTITEPKQGTYPIDPSLLNSANLIPGAVISVGGCNIKVVGVTGGHADCTVAIPQISGAGTAVIDVSQPIAVLIGLDINAVVLGHSIEVELVPV